ncbi:MAG: nucleotidyltransferase family protein [Clostridia bacterium]|nr:nucleotidyltransferase family protein [Clostridia bacterium]
MEIYELLFELLRCGLFGGELSEISVKLLKNEEMQKKVFAAAKKHDIAHLVSYSFDRVNLLDKQSVFGQKCINEQLLAVYRYENINYELGRICKTLEEAEIPFVLLKGAVIRRYYPEPWMRTSCDIDILVKKESIEKAKDALVEKLDYVFYSKGDHDYQIYSRSNVHLELHYHLLGCDTVNKTADELLENAWDYVVLEEGYNYGYKFNRAMIYYYHLIHLAKHLKGGGCGIKPFLDVYIFNGDAYGEDTYSLLKMGGLERLDNVVKKLARVYFGGEEYDDVSKALSEYILCGGVYGNLENRVAIRRGNKLGVIKYALSRVFSPYDILKFRYPELEKKKWLFVPYQFRRWFELIFKEDIKNSLNELQINKNISSEKAFSVAKMWNDLGL